MSLPDEVVRGGFTNKVNAELDLDLDLEVVCRWEYGTELFSV